MAHPDAPAAAPTRPAWVEAFARLYFTKTLTQFVLHGNVADLVPATDPAGGVRYLRFQDYLTQDLFQRRDLVLTYDRAAGLSLLTPEMKQDFLAFLSAYDTLNGTSYSGKVPRDPQEVFALIEKYLLVRLNDGKRMALVLNYAETLAPAGGPGSASLQDRALLVFLRRWAQESRFLQRDMTICLLTHSLQELHPQLTRDPHTAEVEVPFPEEAERLAFIQHVIETAPELPAKMAPSPEVLAQQTAGLSLVQLQTLLQEISTGKGIFGFEELRARKEEVIEAEAGGLLSFVRTKFDLDAVAGHAYAKQHLRQAAQSLRQGRPDVLPMGWLVNGPVGTGKTFLISCFAGEIGIPMVELKNFRSQWQGQTEANLERVLKLLKAMSPVAVMIDEADAALGDRDQSGDSGVSSRVFSMIARFMADTRNRGRILWFLLTARPDLMPVDLKRQGRAEEHLALFYPETLEEQQELFRVMLKKTGIQSVAEEDLPEGFFAQSQVQSGADMEAALTRAKFRAAAEGRPAPTLQDVQDAFADFIPPTYPEEIELQTLAAVLECTSRALLPPAYRDAPRAELAARLSALRLQVG